MSRKTADSHNGFGDVIGVALLAAALLLFVAQFSFDRNDISFLTTHLNKPAHNWIGLLGAWLAYGFFSAFGTAAYVLPALLALFGIAYLLNFLGYLRERLRWSLLWSATLLISLTGLLYIMDDGSVSGKFHERIGAQSGGGLLGWLTYGQTPSYDYGFSLLGPLGATIVYATLCLISLLFLTNFRLGEWIRALLQKEKLEEAQSNDDDEDALERRARELEKQAKKLQEEVARSGLGADLQPVPEPTVRDLSVPQARSNSARIHKTTLPEFKQPAPPAPADAGEVIFAPEIFTTMTEKILSKEAEASEKPVEPKPEMSVAGKIDSKKSEPEVHIADNFTSTAPVATKPRPAPKKSRPLAVAST